MARLPGGSELPTPNAPAGVIRTPRDPMPGAIAGLGENLSRASNELNAAFQEEQGRVDRVMVEDAFTNLRARRIDLSIGEENGFQNKRGGDAVKSPLLKDWIGKFDSAVSEISGKLSNDQQREAFRLRAEASKVQFTQDILQHLSGENKSYRSQVMNSTVDVEKQSAALRWNNPADAMASLERVKAAVDLYAEAEGMDGVVKQATYIKAASPVHEAVVEQALNAGNPEYGKLWLDTHRKDIDEGTVSRLEGALKVSGLRVTAQRATDEIMGLGLSESQAKAKVREQYKGEERDEIERRLSARYADIDAMRKDAENQAADSAWKLVINDKQGKGIDAIPPSLWSRVPGQEQKQITEYLRVRSLRGATEDNWAMLDKVEEAITQGDITDTSQLLRFEPYFKDATFKALRTKVEKRGTVGSSVMQRAFEDRLGKNRSKWGDPDREQWVHFQNYILENVKETKRPEDLDQWADRWFMEGYGAKDTLFSNDPNTLGEARAKGRTDFLIRTPEESASDVKASVALLGKAGINVPANDKAEDEFYTTYYLEAKRWFSARDAASTPGRVAAYAILKSKGQPVTQANIEYLAGQLR